MNRVIKFRAWDGEKMVCVNDIVFSGKEPKAYWRENSVTETSSIINQFTGLHDKNGKEIYEGDILLHHTHEVKTVMKWIDKYCCFAAESIDDVVKGEYNFYQNIDQKSLEVIGNIYKNPELLKP